MEGRNPAGENAWTKRWRLESKGYVYRTARSLIWLAGVGHRRLTGIEGRSLDHNPRALRLSHLAAGGSPKRCLSKEQAGVEFQKYNVVTYPLAINPLFSGETQGERQFGFHSEEMFPLCRLRTSLILAFHKSD